MHGYLRHLTPLSDVQKELLQGVGLSLEVYQHIENKSQCVFIDQSARYTLNINKMEEHTMTEASGISRKGALEELRQLGITGEQVYMIDFIPLIEIMWADGQTQDGEIAVLEDYIEKHIESVNKLAGCNVLRFQDAKTFVDRFIEKRPSPELMETLRNFVKPVRLSAATAGENEKLKNSLLSACMDIAASSVVKYPYDFQERFNLDEKRCFFNILESM